MVGVAWDAIPKLMAEYINPEFTFWAYSTKIAGISRATAYD
jgi:hypothetical protein